MHHLLQILEGTTSTNLDGLGKLLSMMGFLGVVLSQNHLEMQQDCQLQRFDLMIPTSWTGVMNRIILLALIRLRSCFLATCSETSTSMYTWFWICFLGQLKSATVPFFCFKVKFCCQRELCLFEVCCTKLLYDSSYFFPLFSPGGTSLTEGHHWLV